MPSSGQKMSLKTPNLAILIIIFSTHFGLKLTQTIGYEAINAKKLTKGRKNSSSGHLVAEK